MKQYLLVVLLFLSGCSSTYTPTSSSTFDITSTPFPLAALPDGCNAYGTVETADLLQPERGYAYGYRVYLPPCFSEEGNARYPVLYLIPGRSSSPDSWFKAGLAEAVDQLILKKEIPPLIIITTENTDSDPMADTIYHELIPHVESQYPIVDDRRYRAVAGGSLGGIAAYRLAFQYPDTFSSAGIFGAGVISGEEFQVRIWLSQMDDSNRTRVFMNSGTKDPFMLERARAMRSILEDGCVENQLLVDDGEHHYNAWVPNFDTYLKWVSTDW